MRIQLENLTVDNYINYPIASALAVASDTFIGGEQDLMNQSQIKGLGSSEGAVIEAKKLDNRPKNTIPCCLDDRALIIATGLRQVTNTAPVAFEVKRITYRVKPMEQDIKDQQTILRYIIEANPDPIFVKDRQHKWILVNDAFCIFLGKTRDELISKTDYDFFPDREADVFWEQDELVWATGKPNNNQEYLTDAQGNVHVISTNKSMFTDEKGNKFLVGTIRDITDRVKAEEQLKKSEERYRTLVEQSFEAICCVEFDPPISVNIPEEEQITQILHDGYVSEGNDALGRMYGFGSVEEMIGMRTRNIASPKNPANVERAREFIRSGYRLRQIESQHMDAAGKIKYYLNNIVGIVEDGWLRRVWMTQLDITERKQAEMALKRSEELYRGMVESQHDLIARVDRLGRFTFVNDAYCSCFGMPSSELLGSYFMPLVHSEDLNLSLEVMAKLQQPPYRLSCELRMLTISGVRWIAWEGYAIRDETGEIIEIQGVGRDITDRKQMEAAMEVTQVRLRQLLSASPAIVYSGETTGELPLTFISDNVKDLLGYEPQEVLADSHFWRMHVHPEDAPTIFSHIHRLQQSGEITLEYRFLCANGTYRWLQDKVKLVKDAAGNPLEIVGAATDITYRVEAEAEIRLALAGEKELNDLKSRFITTVSHEFRTPLATILSSADLLEFYSEYGGLEKRQAHIQRIQTAAIHLSNMLEEILVMGIAEAGIAQFRPVPVDLEQLCRDVLEEVELSYARGRDIIFTCSGRRALMADPAQVRQILANLLANAFKYSPNDGGVQMDLEMGATQVVLRIRDFGIGIAAEDLPRVFDAFYRGKNVGNIPGTGLGLAIVKKAVELHSGTITVESQPGAGATFIITLPVG
ncbi:PAS domain S-box protein [[Phormidium] sp. ETS-05]|uniref:PAS domain-containing sensor histidine kinase n=1 Tax=[Phormidium] sp. ETS-05 TaxID=222819 RepID=UPI0018EF2539|nr:PAS domain S-box protein [[Phormidium] sp. ETS-05]